jgi:TRAP-type uncharacterized transport system fused permease subunit
VGKVLVPFVFVFAPSLLLKAPGFSWQEFAVAFVGCVLGITFLAAAMSDYLIVRMRTWERLVCAGAALLMVVPGLASTLAGVAIVAPVLLRHLAARRRMPVAPRPG